MSDLGSGSENTTLAGDAAAMAALPLPDESEADYGKRLVRLFGPAPCVYHNGIYECGRPPDDLMHLDGCHHFYAPPESLMVAKGDDAERADPRCGYVSRAGYSCDVLRSQHEKAVTLLMIDPHDWMGAGERSLRAERRLVDRLRETENRPEFRSMRDVNAQISANLDATSACVDCCHYKALHEGFPERRACESPGCRCREFVPAPKRAGTANASIEKARRVYRKPVRFSLLCRVLGKMGGHRYSTRLEDGPVVAVGYIKVRGRECVRCGAWDLAR